MADESRGTVVSSNAEQIKTERQLMAITGKSRSELRKAMTDFAVAIQSVPKPNLETVRPAPVQVKQEKVAMPMRGTIMEGVNPPTTVPAAGQPGGPAGYPLLTTGCVNGVPSAWYSLVVSDPVAL